ncbi:MAG TPA: hypothetical protein VHY34_02985, partial [Caulobacteraceae bacterium]|nr:hypothetical protein [Caulobacteraceae bacterium]
MAYGQAVSKTSQQVLVFSALADLPPRLIDISDHRTVISFSVAGERLQTAEKIAEPVGSLDVALSHAG